jgi:hypothetical protein
MNLDWVFWGTVLVGMLAIAFLLVSASGLSD